MRGLALIGAERGAADRNPVLRGMSGLRPVSGPPPNRRLRGFSRGWLVRTLGLLLVFCATVAQAEPAQEPRGEVVLTATGAIHAASGAMEFDMAALKALPSVSFATTTPWTKGVTTFKGVELKDFLTAIGARGQRLHCVAMDDYAIDIPASDAVGGGPILAYQSDGKPMTARDKGPLWIVYPYDAKAEYRSAVVYSQSIWQLRRIDVGD